MSETPRLLFVHAHPDDETLATGATIAHYAERGARVQIVTCTLGEEGEVIGDRYAQLAADQADQLGGYRIFELTTALTHLGVDEPTFLGGPGHWRDSGMEGIETSRTRRFVDADLEEATALLVGIIRDLRPHVVVTYDPDGGYGHPDHKQAHVVTTAAVAASGDTDRFDGEPWQVPKFYWAVTARSAFDAGFRAIGDVPDSWRRITLEDMPFGFSDNDIDAEVVGSLEPKIAALRAHATQVTVSADGTACALSNDLALPIMAQEHYVLVTGSPGERDARGWETDLLAGLNLE